LLSWNWPADALFHTLIKIVDFKRAAKKERSQEVKKPRITVRVIKYGVADGALTQDNRN
jgi:hypothetical protein